MIKMPIFLRNIFNRKTYFWWIVAFFIAQSVWYSASVRYAIPPDESYHTKFIKYYSEQPLLSGPIIADQGNGIYELGDIERMPSYLYHYLLSFPQRMLNNFDLTDDQNVFYLRLINILFSVLSLVMIKRLMELTCSNRFIISGSLTLLVLTGMFTWISSAVNYDNLSMLSIFVFLYLGVKFVKEVNYASFLLAFSVALLSILIKFTVAPLIGFVAVVVAWLAYWDGLKFREFATGLIGYIKTPTNRLMATLIVILALVSVVLFSERIVGNLLSYQSVTPSCDVIHTEEQCLESAIFKRTKIVELRYQKLVASGQELFKPVGDSGKWIDTMYQRIYFYPSKALFVGLWTKTMYERLYFYYGHRVIPANDDGRLAVSLIGGLIALSVVIKSRIILENRWEKLFITLMIFYILQVFFFNLNSYLNSGAMLAYQGRYLLPVMPFFFYFSLKLFAVTRESLSGILSRVYAAVTVAAIIWFSLVHFPPYVFIKGSNTSWYTEQTKTFNTNLKDSLRDLASKF